jgi:hypothetical protein
VLSFSRDKNGDRVVPLINYSAMPVRVQLQTKYLTGTYVELFTGQQYILKGADLIDIPAWGYLVLVKGK